MVKFVAADMDGTLLDSNKNLSPGLFPAIRQLAALGVKFAVASGRQYFNLVEIFREIEDDIVFICENGAILFEGKEKLFVSEIPAEALAVTVADIRNIEDAMPVFCGANGAYIEDSDPELIRNVAMYYTRFEKVEDVMDAAKKDTICKIAVFDRKNAETNCYPQLLKYQDRFVVSLSGARWVDLMNPGVNKGTAIQKFREIYGLNREECMAFGDYLNDYEMLRECGHSYAMANAHPDLKEISRYVAPSNDEDGVVRSLADFFHLV